MKKLFTLMTLSFMISATQAQTYFDINVPNGDMESTQEVTLSDDSTEIYWDEMYVWTPTWDGQYKEAIDFANSGRAPGEGVDASQAFKLAVGGIPQGWAIQFRSRFIDVRPTGEGSYIITWSVKADQPGSIGAFFHVIALWDEDGGWLGASNEIGLDNVLTEEQYANLDQGYVTVSDTFDIPATAINNDGVEKSVAYMSFAAQCGSQANTYYWDNITLQGPESFYDITFDISGIVQEDTASLESATVIFDGLDYTTNADGTVTVEDLKGGAYDWSVSAEGLEEQSGTLNVSAFQTVTLYLEEPSVVMSTRSEEIFTKVYPNPTSHTLRVESSGLKLSKIELFTISGASLLKEKPNARYYDLNVSALPTGVYILKMINENNEYNSEQIIIK